MKKMDNKDIKSDPAVYVTEPGILTVDLETLIVSIHDGFTPGGIPINGGGGGPVTWSSIIGKPTFATVATSGDYDDLSGAPTLAPVATGGTLAATNVTGLSAVATGGTLAATSVTGLSPVATNGLYSSLTGTPSLAPVATNGLYSSLSGTPVLAAVATSGEYSDLSGIPPAAQDTILPQATTMLRVSPIAIVGADPLTPNGSEAAPFLTIQEAVDYATTTYPVTTSTGIHIGIQIDPGLYVEDVTVTRALTHLVGTGGRTKGTRISGTVTINPAAQFTTAGNCTLSISGIFIETQTGNSLVFSGSNRFTFFGNDMYAYVQAGAGAAVFQDNTSVGGTKLFFNDSDFNTINGNGSAFDISNSYFFTLQQSNVDIGPATVGMRFNNTSATLSNVVIDSAAATTIDVLNNQVVLFNNNIIASAANSTGARVASGAVLFAANNAFSVPPGTGFVVQGVAGATFVQASNYLVPAKNVKISSAMTTVTMGTTFTPA